MNGYFVGNFFGKKDTWAETKENIIFLTEQEVKEIKEIYPIIFEMYKIMDDSNKLKSLLNL